MLRRWKLRWPANDQWHAEAAVIAKLLGPDVRLSVIAKKHDDRALGQSVGLKLLQNQPDFSIELRCRVEILGPVLARHGMVRIVRRDHDLGRVGMPRRMVRAVRLLKIDLCIKWLMLRKI